MKKLFGRVTSATAVLAAVLLTLGGLAAATKPVVVTAGDPEPFFSVDFSPEKLSERKSAPTPVTFELSFFKRAVDEQPPPPLSEFRLAADKHFSVDVSGIPTCAGTRSAIRRSFEEVREMCRPAVIGGGRIEVAVKFPDQPMATVGGRLLAINGGVKDGVTRMYLLADLSAPVVGLTPIAVEVKKIRKGRYGTEAIATIPKIAGGAGSITKLNLALKRGIVSAACLDGRLQASGAALFADGTSSQATIIRTCTARPSR